MKTLVGALENLSKSREPPFIADEITLMYDEGYSGLPPGINLQWLVKTGGQKQRTMQIWLPLSRI